MGYDWTEQIGTPVRENLRTYAETDPNGTIVRNERVITYTDFDRVADARVSFDFGASYFDNDFVHTFTITCSELDTAGAYAGFYSLKNTNIDDGTAWDTVPHITMFWYRSGATTLMYLREGNGASGGTSATSEEYARDGTPYYMKVAYVSGEGANGTIYLYGYTDATHETLVDRQYIILGGAMDYRWLQTMVQYAGGAGGLLATGTNSDYVLRTMSGGGVTTEPELDLYWSYDDIDGTSIYDHSGKGITGTIEDNGGAIPAALVDGVAGRALDIAPNKVVTAALTLSGNLSMSVWTNSRTWVGWASPLTTYMHAAQGFGMGFTLVNGAVVRVYAANDDAYTYTDRNFAFSVDTWYHIVITYDSGQVAIYVNSVKQGADWARTVDFTDCGVASGRWATNYNGYYYDGIVDEARIYGVALSQGQIDYLYNNPQGPIVTVEDSQILEMRTHINSERVDRASLAAYVWTDSTIDGQEVLQTEIAELRTAIDDAYDGLLTCSAHYTSDDSTHYTTDKSSHDSSVCGTHYTTDEAAHYSTDDSTDDGTHYTTHYITHDATAYKTHNAAQNSSRKTFYTTGIYAEGLCIFRTYDKAKLRREE
jgi:hypothetical protein